MYLFTFTAILASAVTTASAAGCYSETGPGWGDLRQAANNAADAVCNGDSGGVAGNFDGNGPAFKQAKAGDVTMSIREELLGIQTGTVEDTHGWLTRLA